MGYLAIGNKRIKYVTGDKRRKKKRYYDHDVLIALKKLWEGTDFICSKRLAPYLEEYITVLEKFKEIKLTHEVREKLFTISPATIDRLLAPVRKGAINQRQVYHQTRKSLEEEYPHTYLQ